MSINVNASLNMSVMRAESERDRQSGLSNQARDAMECFSPQHILGALMEIFKVLACLSG